MGNRWLGRRGPALCIAHRGASRRAPENTMAAFRMAAEMGADAVELDVMLTSDDEAVVFHDFDLNRLTGVSGIVDNLAYSAIADLRVHGEPIPRLEEIAGGLPDRLLLNIELKVPPEQTWSRVARLVRKVRDIVSRNHARGRCLISSFDRRALLLSGLLAPRLPRALLYVPPRWTAPAIAGGRLLIQALHPSHYGLEAKFVEKARRRGYRVNVWTVDEPGAIAAALGMGVDGIITNDPEAFFKVSRHEPSRS